MNTVTKNALISALLCSVILIMDMDLSYLKTSLKEVTQKVIEKRKVSTEYHELRYSEVLPDDTGISIRNAVNLNMSSCIHSIFTDMKPSVKNYHASQDAYCRGSPNIRAP